jgi:hypothetical protein
MCYALDPSQAQMTPSREGKIETDPQQPEKTRLNERWYQIKVSKAIGKSQNPKRVAFVEIARFEASL